MANVLSTFRPAELENAFAELEKRGPDEYSFPVLVKKGPDLSDLSLSFIDGALAP